MLQNLTLQSFVDASALHLGFHSQIRKTSQRVDGVHDAGLPRLWPG